MKSQFHEGFYSFAKYYDIAFDFRDIYKECTFFKKVFLKYTERQLSSLIEFGAGPAAHVIELSQTLSQVTAVDLSNEMTEYSQKLARALKRNLTSECADMITYRSNKKYDMAVLLMDSTSYLLSNQDVITHLQSVANVLNSNGLYVLEMNHPKSVFEIAKTAISEWEMTRDHTKVKVRWGAENDVFDPITQLTEVSVLLEYEDGPKKGLIEDKSLQRCFTATEFAALVSASGVFKIVDWYGSLNTDIPFNNEKHAWRMVPVLQKI